MRRSPLVVAAIAVAACATAAPAAQAAFPGANGPILFDRTQPYEDQARTLTIVPGGPPAPLSAGFGGMSPSLSPDGSRLVFSRIVTHGRYGAADVFVANADGSGELPLTDGNGPDHGASWSPDGRRIVWSQKGVEVRDPTELWIMNADGSGKAQLTRAGQHSYSPVFSPDGTKIAFQRYPLNDFDSADLYLYDLAGGGEQQLTNSAGTETDPDFSPDGTKLAYAVGYAAIATIPVSGGTSTPLIRSTATAAYRAPSYSPDGTRIAFVSYDYDAETAALATAAADGSGVADITPRHPSDEPPAAPSWAVGPAGPPPVVVPVPRPPLPGPAPRPVLPADRAVDGVSVGGDAGAALSGGRLTLATRVTARSEPITAVATGAVTIAAARGGRASASAKARGRARRGARARATTVALPRATVRVAAGGSALLRQKLGGAALSAIARALRARRAVTATIVVTVTDASGNVSRTTRRVKIAAAPAGGRRAARGRGKRPRALAVAAAKARPPRAAVEDCKRFESAAGKRRCRASNAANKAILKKLLNARLVGTRSDGSYEEWLLCANGRYELRSTSGGSTGISRGSWWKVESGFARQGGRWFNAVIAGQGGTVVGVAMRGGRWQVGIEFGDEPSELGPAVRSDGTAACAAL